MKRVAFMMAAFAAVAAWAYNGAGRLEGQKIEYAPNSLWTESGTKTAAAVTEAEWNAAGWDLVVIPAPVPPEGYMVASSRWERVEGRISRVYDYAPVPPRVWRYSKLKLIVAAKSAGRWDSLKAFVKSANLEDEWLACQYFEDGYPAFVTATNAVVASGVATDAEVKALLEASRDE